MFLMYVHKKEQTDWTDCVKIYKKTCILGQNIGSNSNAPTKKLFY